MNLRAKLIQTVETNDTLNGRLFDLAVQFLIILSIISFSVETLPDLSSGTKKLLQAIEIIIVVTFTLEYLLRVYVAQKKWNYILSFYGIIDLLAVLPFYITSGVDLRSLRIFRLLRLFRIFKLLRYNRALNRFAVALKIAKEEFILFTIITAMLLYIAAVGIYFFEHSAQPDAFKSIFHSLWWAVATLTTVGYGDIYPITAGGKVFTFFILMIGLGIVAVPAGLLASALSKAKADEDQHPST